MKTGIKAAVGKMPVAFALTTVVFMAFSSLFMPIHRDEAVFLTIGKRMALGEMAYVDYFDHKMPGIYLVASYLFSLFGATVFPARILMMMINILGAIMVKKILDVLGKVNVSVLAGSAYFVLAIWYQGNFFITEGIVNIFVLSALWIYLKNQRSFIWSQILGIGLLLSIAMLFKQTALLVMIVFGIFLVLNNDNKKKTALVYISGVCIPWAVLLAWLYLNKAIVDFWEDAVIFNLTSYPPYPLEITLRETIPILLPAIFWWVPGLVCLVFKRSTVNNWMMIRVLGLSLLPIVLMRPYHHYWLLILPFALMGAVRIASSVRVSYIMWWINLVGISMYYSASVLTNTSAELADQLRKISSSNCENIIEVASYFYTDCKPMKYFYEPGSRYY